MATYDPTELDYWNGNQEAEACVQQATSVTTACDKESAPEYDYNDVKHEVDACAQQATSVTTARDEGSAPEPHCDYNDYIYENPEVEACAQQATSTMAARDEESANTTTTKKNWRWSAAVTSTPDEEPATEAKSDGSVSAVRVLFKRPVCEPDPDRTVVYESFGCNTGWGPARAVLAAQERAAQAEACDGSLCEVTSSSNSRRTGEPKGEATTANTAPTTPDPLVPKHPPTESILSKEDGHSPSPVPKHPPTESILSKEDGNNLGPALKCPLPESIRCKEDDSSPGPAPERSSSESMLSEEDGGEPGPSPERDKPDENRAEPSPHARVYTDDELDALEKG
ncbi:hypothetical protein PF008_g1759 [Phytophthora fragariae]|uniref:Uncharacterized protein n=1 Tax=Phytophthora fragariae TaxID=53985 RepID=A0A6G0SJU3_9STRA|nr:hypothetical protein PF008_g1759 [Phytophthora fragariae]